MYVQQNALKRTWMMFQVAVGEAQMKRCTALVPPSAYGKNSDSPIEGGVYPVDLIRSFCLKFVLKTALPGTVTNPTFTCSLNWMIHVVICDRTF